MANTSNDRIEIYDYDETYVQVIGERALIVELGDFFTFEVPNARFMPSFQNRLWDGKIRLLDFQTQRIYRGLIPRIKKFCEDRDYECVIEDAVEPIKPKLDLDKFIDGLGLPFEPHDYQRASIKHMITENRCTLLSPTSSGKSLMIYAIARYFLEHTDEHMLICVPTIDLVNQMLTEFEEYNPSYNIRDKVHKIYGGQPKDTDKRITISTWQSLYENPKKYFSKFGVVFVDEAHQAQSDSIKGMYQKASNARYRFGCTGTLNDLNFHQLVIEGLTGPVYRSTSTKTLMDRKIISELNIKCAVLKYDDATRAACKKFTFQEEMKFITSYEKRNKFIANLTKRVGEGKNVLVLTAYKNHILELEKELKAVGKEVYVVTGDTQPDERERIRLLAGTKNGIVILATYGVYSTGISIKNLQYIIMATGSKSLIRLLQTIGRGLRLDGKTNKVTAFDIVDDISFKSKKNYILRHFFERIKIYTREQFKYKTININI